MKQSPFSQWKPKASSGSPTTVQGQVWSGGRAPSQRGPKGTVSRRGPRAWRKNPAAAPRLICRKREAAKGAQSPVLAVGAVKPLAGARLPPLPTSPFPTWKVLMAEYRQTAGSRRLAMKVAGSCSDQLGIGTEPLQEKRGGGLFGPHFGQAAIPMLPAIQAGRRRSCRDSPPRRPLAGHAQRAGVGEGWGLQASLPPDGGRDPCPAPSLGELSRNPLQRCAKQGWDGWPLGDPFLEGPSSCRQAFLRGRRSDSGRDALRRSPLFATLR